MASLKEIKTRIGSVQNTRKITSAMKMVASSKLHHAQVMIENMLPYENMLESILKTFLAADVDARGIITEEREVKKVALLVFSSNSSMCGGFNSNVIKRMISNVVEAIVSREVGEKEADDVYTHVVEILHNEGYKKYKRVIETIKKGLVHCSKS